jgi:hypothetical protein
MISKYSPPPKLKCHDCKVYSQEVSYKEEFQIKLCVSCYIDRQIKKLPKAHNKG